LARTGTPPARRAAQAFADHLNSVLNRTVTDSRLSLIAEPDAGDSFEITRLVDGARNPLDLVGSPLKLFVRQNIQVIDDHCQTESYAYRLQSDQSAGSWVLRWEYFRLPPKFEYRYPLAHVHTNGVFEDGSDIGRLHVPTHRVPIELVIWHLVAEWQVESKMDGWQQVLRESIAGFDRRRTDLPA
jgi:hypothetical protein